LQDALNQYNDNLVWEGDITKARLALEAIRWLLVNRPMSAESGDEKINWTSLEAKVEELSDYIRRFGVRRSNFVRAVPRII